ncbi:MAG: PSD1 domain-containing protein, partial [Planctomycetaceae bacterium]|nr:PSD1 domain-containing protein [Planctomycetaceae bacterium]
MTGPSTLLILTPPNRRHALCLMAVVAAVTLGASGNSAADDREEFFENRIRPLLVNQCAECHSGKTPEGDLRIDDIAALRKGGMNGPAVIAHDATGSLLLQRVLTDDPDLLMPPEKRLSEAQIADLTQWISTGAFWPESNQSMNTAEDRAAYWSFQPLQEVTPPDVAALEWSSNPIDRFIAAGHESRGLTPVEPATKRELIRRTTLDLTGLTPTIEDVDAFLADDSPQAFEKVVDRLLASPEYGERWGRHWLDQARYADTSGDGTDTPIPEARYYRDYVIQAFNDDLPYDQFLVEQIAGDLLAAENPDNPRYNDQIIATGYIALSRRFGNSAFAEMNLIIDDTIDTIGKSTMGLTLGCARCHHHKFDPVTMDDYYGMYGYFENTQYPHAGTEHQKDRDHFVALRKEAGLREDYESLEAYAVADKQKLTGDSSLRVGGDPNQKGNRTPRGYLAVFTEPTTESSANDSGRLQFAKWLVSEENPLTPRVMVNRIWQYHFGTGIVATSSNFGLQGAKPSHPELLEWLSAEFVRNNWSIKHIHRLIVLSRTYQLSSKPDEYNIVKDQANTGYWRHTRHRMDAEAL